MPDGDFEWQRLGKCRNMGMLLNYATGRIAIFDTKQSDHRENVKDKTSLIFEVDLEYPPELN